MDTTALLVGKVLGSPLGRSSLRLVPWDLSDMMAMTGVGVNQGFPLGLARLYLSVIRPCEYVLFSTSVKLR